MKDKWIFFDVGSTLVDEESAHKARYYVICDDIRLKLGREMPFEEFSELMYEGGALGKSPFFHAEHKLGIRKWVGYPSGLETVIPGVPEMLRELKKKYRLGVIANQHPNLAERLDAFGFAGCFDAIFGSADVGYQKPDPEFYRYALREVGAAPCDAVMVGDRCDNDIAPAKSVGMHTVRVPFSYYGGITERSEDEVAEIKIDGILDLPAALDKLFSE